MAVDFVAYATAVTTATRFFDEHVEADAVHEAVAAHDLAEGLAVSEPLLVSDILFGAKALLALEAEFAHAVCRSCNIPSGSIA